VLATGAVGGHIRPMFETAQRGGDAPTGKDRQQEVRLRGPELAQAHKGTYGPNARSARR